jgi:hypothetical protein
MAGTIPLSMTQQFDVYGQPLAGGQLYIIQAGTVSTPQDAFQDVNLTIKMPYPMTLDAAGRVPQFFLADGTVKIRLQDAAGVVQLAADAVLVIGPSGGGGGGATVDPTQLIQTGNMIFRHGVGVIAGYVRLNNLTIGSATSGATERANADCQALFNYLWGVDPNLAVVGGRGATAAADWTANKQLAVPDWRGYALGALDDMGNGASGRLSSSYWGGNPVLLGSVGGGEFNNLAYYHLPPHSHSGLTGVENQAHSHGGVVTGANTYSSPGGATAVVQSLQFGNTGGESQNHNHNFTTDNGPGSASAFRTIGPRKLVTFYMKL